MDTDRTHSCTIVRISWYVAVEIQFVPFRSRAFARYGSPSYTSAAIAAAPTAGARCSPCTRTLARADLASPTDKHFQVDSVTRAEGGEGGEGGGGWLSNSPSAHREGTSCPLLSFLPFTSPAPFLPRQFSLYSVLFLVVVVVVSFCARANEEKEGTGTNADTHEHARPHSRLFPKVVTNQRH